MSKTKRRKIYFIIFWFLMATSFIFFAVVLVAYANGYHLNTKTLRLQRTSMIVVDGNVTAPAKITINGDVENANFPNRIGRLIPGRYEVKVTKDGYQDWLKIAYLSGGQAVKFNDVTLFLKSATPLKTTGITSATVNSNYQTQSAKVKIDNDELRYNGLLVTRFSQKIMAAIYDSNINHFYVQLGDEIHALDQDGSNNVLLFKLPTSVAVNFYSNNENIYFVSSNNIYIVKVR